jgi:hypothetical protein
LVTIYFDLVINYPVDEWCNSSSILNNCLEELPIPRLLVGYQEEWIKLPPTVLNLWEKARLEPYSPKKNVSYFVLCPDNQSLLADATNFFKELSCVYEVSFLLPFSC